MSNTQKLHNFFRSTISALMCMMIMTALSGCATYNALSQTTKVNPASTPIIESSNTSKDSSGKSWSYMVNEQLSANMDLIYSVSVITTSDNSYSVSVTPRLRKNDAYLESTSGRSFDFGTDSSFDPDTSIITITTNLVYTDTYDSENDFTLDIVFDLLFDPDAGTLSVDKVQSIDYTASYTKSSEPDEDE